MIIITSPIPKGMTTQKGWHDATTPTEESAVFIISNPLQIAIFTTSFPTLIFPFSQCRVTIQNELFTLILHLFHPSDGDGRQTVR